MYSTNYPVYYLGGGTCCGKSTLAELLCKAHNLALYRQDDDLFPFLERLAEAGNERAAREASATSEEMWMRDPEVLVREETALYHDLFPLTMEAVATLAKDGPVLAEGAGFLPSLMKERDISRSHFFCMIPTDQFRREQYAQRPWIGQYLQDVSDRDKAFDNWMSRDHLFSQNMLNEAKKLGYPTLLVDGAATIEENLQTLQNAFGL